MTTPIRWGILGPGSIAHKFAAGLQTTPTGTLIAIGSRNQQRAEEFADQYGAPNRHDSYQALATDPEIDAVYIATPHPFHKDHSILCLEAGKAVLCEKPFTINTAEAEAVVATARTQDIFLMEAMWTRYLPIIGQVREWLATGAIGTPRLVSADFGFRAAINPEGRLFNPSLGGNREERIELPLAGNGYHYEAQEVARCLDEGLRESPTMPLDETVALMRILDEIRIQIGLQYPMEQRGKK